MNPYVIIDQFLPSDACVALRTLHQSARRCGSGIDPRYTTADRQALLEQTDASLLVALDRTRDAVRRQVRRYFDIEGPLYPSFTDLACYGHGAEHPPHADNAYFVADGARLSWKPRPGFAHRAYSAILYLNDYDSGALEFGRPHGGAPRLSLTPTLVARPRAGRLVLFESSADHIHRVTPCEHGDRYSLAMWLTRDRQFREPDSFVAAACLHRSRAGAGDTIRLQVGADCSLHADPDAAGDLRLTLHGPGHAHRVLVPASWLAAIAWLSARTQPFSLAHALRETGSDDVTLADCLGLLLRHDVLHAHPPRGADAPEHPQP